MDKKFRKKFFLICLAGGIVFAVPFFFGFGSAIGYPLYWAFICLGFGLFFAVAFYFIWIIIEKFQKPFSFENPKAQKKLLDYEATRNASCGFRFSAYMNYGRGLKQEVCETSIYFEAEVIHIAFCHFGKIYSFDVPYPSIKSAFIEDDRVLIIQASEFGNMVFSVKDFIPQLQEALTERGIYEEIISE